MSDEIIRQCQAAGDQFWDLSYIWAEHPRGESMPRIPDRYHLDASHEDHICLGVFYAGDNNERLVFPWLLGEPEAAARLANIARQLDCSLGQWCRRLALAIGPERRVYLNHTDDLFRTDESGKSSRRPEIKDSPEGYSYRLAGDAEPYFAVITNVFAASVGMLQAQGESAEGRAENRLPEDLITKRVAVIEYEVSEITLQRYILEGKIRSYQQRKGGKHRIREYDVKRHFGPRR